jgi:uncharacterized membrane protein YdjX (TVP38/TMEM64 family)
MKLREVYLKNRLWLLLVICMAVLFILFLIPILIFVPVQELFTHSEVIKTYILSYGGWAIAVYILLSIVAIVAPPIPNEIVPVVGGIVFGFWTALIFGLIARIIGSTINYWLGTKIRKGVFAKLINEEEQERLKKYTKKIGWQAIVISRFIPSTDTDLIAYIAGISKMDYKSFIVASFFGMLVPVSFTIFIGASLFTNKYLFYSLISFYILGVLFAPKIIKGVFKEKLPV